MTDAAADLVMNLDEALARARSEAADGRERFVALRVPGGPLDPLAAFAAASGSGFYWEQPREGRAFVGLGAVASIEVHGEERFGRAEERTRELFERLSVVNAPGAGGSVRLVGGFSFAARGATLAEGDTPDWRDFPDGRLVLPETAVEIEGSRTTVSAVCRVGADTELETARLQLLRSIAELQQLPPLVPPGELEEPPGDGAQAAPEYRARADRPHADYRTRVAAALDAIARGDFEKVVVARSVHLAHTGGFDAVRLLETLRHVHPSCTLFAIAAGQSAFVGATPERLLRLHHHRIETAALAGTAPRGRNPGEDARLGRELVESKKEQAEHAIVVRALVEALQPCCDGLSAPESPRLRRLEGIQHLETPIQGKLARGISALALLPRLHPSPAVGGAPREAALAWLERNEELERGWYAGPVGWVDADGDGEFCVALRSALIQGDQARFYAGAGIVEGSQPESELRETRLKLRALLGALLEL
jgi:isochorismate synthase